jgi:hypothetical protein
MDTDALRKLIADLTSEEEGLVEMAGHVEAKLAKVRAAKIALTVLDSDDSEPAKFEGKLAEACRAVLKNSMTSLSPTEVRDQLSAIGYDLSKHTNHLASIHSVLRRLAAAKKDVSSKEAKDGSGTRYFWTENATRYNQHGSANAPRGTLGDLARVTASGKDITRIAANLQEFQKTYANAVDLFKNDKAMAQRLVEVVKQLERLRAGVEIPKLPEDLEEAIGLKPKR